MSNEFAVEFYLTSDSKIDVECRDAQGRDQAEFRGIGWMVVGSKKFKREAERRADRLTGNRE